MITGIGHLAFQVANMNKTIEFYCEKLKLTHAFTLERDGKPWIVYIKVVPGQFIEFFYDGVPDGGKPTSEIAFRHICLTVDDIEAVASMLNDVGIPIDRPPSTGSDGNKQMWIHDPDGTPIEFMQISPTSNQALS